MFGKHSSHESLVCHRVKSTPQDYVTKQLLSETEIAHVIKLVNGQNKKVLNLQTWTARLVK